MFTIAYTLVNGRVEYPSTNYRSDRRGGPVYYTTNILDAYTWATKQGAANNLLKYDPRHLASFAETVEREVVEVTL